MMAACCSMTCCWCSTREAVVPSRWAKGFYCVSFVGMTALALFLRSNPGHILHRLEGAMPHPTEDCRDPTDGSWDSGCLGRFAALRVLLSAGLFHALMCLLLLGHTDGDPRRFRTKLQSGFWFVKVLLLLGAVAGSFFIPHADLGRFATACRVLSPVFLLAQIVLLVDLAYDWNESWVARGWQRAVLACTAALAALWLALVALTFAWFTRGAGGCALNKLLASTSLLVPLALAAGSLAAEHGAVLTAAVVAVQISYTIFAACLGARSGCNARLGSDAAQGWSLFVGVAITVASVAYAAFSAGGSGDAFGLHANKAQGSVAAKGAGASSDRERLRSAISYDPEIGAAPGGGESGGPGDADGYEGYNYSFFHFIFFLACTYMAMLLTAWGADEKIEQYSIEEGRIGLWVRVSSAWATGLVYAWTLAAPSLLKNREF